MSMVKFAVSSNRLKIWKNRLDKLLVKEMQVDEE